MHHRKRNLARSTPPPRRSGVTLFELVVTIVLLGAVATSFVPIMRRVEQLRRDVGQRELALQGINNLLDELTSLPWDRLTQSSVEERLNSEPNRLDAAEWTVTVADLESSWPARRITLEVRWPTPDGGRSSPVALSAVVYQRKESP